jgi:hypothetical protein
MDSASILMGWDHSIESDGKLKNDMVIDTKPPRAPEILVLETMGWAWDLYTYLYYHVCEGEEGKGIHVGVWLLVGPTLADGTLTHTRTSICTFGGMACTCSRVMNENKNLHI